MVYLLLMSSRINCRFDWLSSSFRRLAGALEGLAYCFLPLPVKTGLPCHVNGYFELSR